MATTTPNFGWAVPTSTDLVKDGAVAIETLGDSIDASLVDLKGGTTGQVLSKATNTDMDFTWVAQDDSNAIQNAIVDAKGDIIAATADNTPARLAVGTANQVLTVDSSTATGLKWATPATSTGKLIQVITAEYSTETDNSTTTYADTGLTATITPTLSTSKILCMVSLTMGKSADNANNAANIQILRGATSILENKQLFYTGTAIWNISQWATNILDSPATTSATTYKVQFKQWFNNGARVRANNDNSKSTIILMEIGA
jgi:hypothetical protein